MWGGASHLLMHSNNRNSLSASSSMWPVWNTVRNPFIRKTLMAFLFEHIIRRLFVACTYTRTQTLAHHTFPWQFEFTGNERSATRVRIVRGGRKVGALFNESARSGGVVQYSDVVLHNAQVH